MASVRAFVMPFRPFDVLPSPNGHLHTTTATYNRLMGGYSGAKARAVLSDEIGANRNQGQNAQTGLQVFFLAKQKGPV